MPFGQLVIGPPGSGKSTYCHGLYQFLTALERPVLVVNLDPAAERLPYPNSISITSLISLSDAMSAHGLGPNGAMLYCLEYLEANMDWLEGELERILEQNGFVGDKREQAFVVFDTPGQVELSTDHGSLKRIVERLQSAGGWRLAAVHLLDAHHIADAGKYVAVLLLSLRTMLQLELPHVNVLSKIDLLATSAPDLPFHLSFYTDPSDLSRLTPLLDQDPRLAKFSALNQAICDLVDDFGLVGFETLCVEDKDSMLHLVRTIDQALGYVAPMALPSSTSSADSHTHHAHKHSHPATTPVDLSRLSRATDVQEKWLDNIDEYAEYERSTWANEGEWARQRANEQSRRQAGVKEDLIGRADEEADARAEASASAMQDEKI